METHGQLLPKEHFCPFYSSQAWGQSSTSLQHLKICRHPVLDLWASDNATVLSKPLSFTKWGVSQGGTVPEQGWSCVGHGRAAVGWQWKKKQTKPKHKTKKTPKKPNKTNPPNHPNPTPLKKYLQQTQCKNPKPFKAFPNAVLIFLLGVRL